MGIMGSYSSDVEGVQPLASDFDPGGGELPQWGNLVMLGAPVDQHSLSEQMEIPVWTNLLLNTVYLHDFAWPKPTIKIEMKNAEDKPRRCFSWHSWCANVDQATSTS